MLTHVIEKYFPPMRITKSGKPKFINGSEPHRRHILERTIEGVLRDQKFELGRSYFLHGRPEKGQLVMMHDDYKNVTWDGLKVLCMEVYVPGDENTYMYHPSDLSTERKS